MARKEPSFKQLYDYITREGDFDPSYSYSQNFLLDSREAILEEFERNSKLLAKRKNWNYLYHEIISITRSSKLEESQQKKILKEIVDLYSKLRGKGCLVFGGLHDEKDNNLHFHLIISANPLNKTNRLSLKKSEFSAIKKQIEKFTLVNYPELGQDEIINGSTKKDRVGEKEQQLKNRTGEPSKRDIFKEKLSQVFLQAENKKQFFELLKSEWIEVYTRGKTIWFLDLEENKKYRLKTLGLENEFDRLSDSISQDEKQTQTAQAETQSKQEEQNKRVDEIREIREIIDPVPIKQTEAKKQNPVKAVIKNVLNSLESILPFISEKAFLRQQEIKELRAGKGKQKQKEKAVFYF